MTRLPRLCAALLTAAVLSPAAVMARQPEGTPARALAARASKAAATLGAASTVLAGNAEAPTPRKGVLLDTFHAPSDADDTASLARAVAAGVPILLGPRIYFVHDFGVAPSVASFILRGVAGRSVIRRISAGNSAFFSIGAATVLLDGVIFDMNRAAVAASQWGVLLNAGGQAVTVRNSVFENNSGDLGAGFALIDTGQGNTGRGGGGMFSFVGNEVTGNAFNGLYFGSVGNGLIADNCVHDNDGFGIFAGAYGMASSANHLSDVRITRNRVVRNGGTGIAVGGYAAPYVFGTPAAVDVVVASNVVEGNGGYGIGLQGDRLAALGNVIGKAGAGSLGGIDCNSRDVRVTNNLIDVPGAGYGIDCGGAIDALVAGNSITMTTGTAIDMGGTRNSSAEGNRITLSGTATAISVFATETDSDLVPFPTVTSGLAILRNRIAMAGPGTRGILLFDNAGGYPGALPTRIRHNDFLADASVSDAHAISYLGAADSVEMDANTWNGSSTANVDPEADGSIVFSNVHDAIRGGSTTTAVQSIVSDYVHAYGAGGSILYVYPMAGGSGYDPKATTLAATCPGLTGWSGTPLISQGVIVGVRTSANGSGCSTGFATVAVTDSSGSGHGATFAVGTRAVLPRHRRLQWLGRAILLGSDGATSTSPGGPTPRAVASGPVLLEADASGAFWTVAGRRATSRTGSSQSPGEGARSDAPTFTSGPGRRQAQSDGKDRP